ncbi:MAG: hypothetical protein QM831_36710 [Kofleriaceae bacterium]
MTQVFRTAMLVLVACRSPAPPPSPPPTHSDAASDTRPRCIQAGGMCVGPAAIQANPSAPCAAGYHRVDDVTLPTDRPGHAPACLGIPMGEEACCIK